eukprot:4050270-Pyramimonas_sp.AAC.1
MPLGGAPKWHRIEVLSFKICSHRELTAMPQSELVATKLPAITPCQFLCWRHKSIAIVINFLRRF